MPIYNDCIQYSESWERARLGIPTSSKFDKIITPTGKESKQWKSYCYGLIAERITGRKNETYSSPFMERGLEEEVNAVNQYEMLRNIETQHMGFITNDAGTIGCSPDRLVGEDGILEIKCPAPQTHVGYLLGEELSMDYYPQIQGQLYISERKWVDIISYHPEIRPVIIRVERDEAYMSVMAELLGKVTSYIEEKLAFIGGVK